MTTCAATPNDVSAWTARLECLAACDGDLAQRLRKEVRDDVRESVSHAPADAVRWRVEAWLAESDAELIVVPGVGSGDEAVALIEALPESSALLILERDAARLARLFARSPLETLAEAGRLKTDRGENGQVLASAMGSMLDLPKKPRIRLFEMTVVAPEDARVYAATLMDARHLVRLSVSNLRTLIHQGPQGQYNAFKNLPLIVRQPGAARLFKAFDGRLALVVAAGPSLTHALPYIREHRDGFVLIAVGTALRPLARAGLKPDLVVTADPSRMTGLQFTGDYSDLYLVSTVMAYPPVLRKFKGVFVTCESGNSIGTWARPHLDMPTNLAAAGTVTLTAMDLAVKLGCDPVATVGLDLCLAADGTSHADHSMYHGQKADPAQMRRLIAVPGNRRETVYTISNMKNYIELIGNYVLHCCGTRLININTDGARIRGMELADPESIGDWASEPFDAFSVIDGIYRNWQPPEQVSIARALNDAMECLSETGALATRAAMICNRLIAMLRRPTAEDEAQARIWLDELSAIDRKIVETRDADLLTSMCTRAICFSMEEKKTEEEEKFSEGVLANRRSRLFYETFAKTACQAVALARETLAAIKSGRDPDLADFESSPMACGLHALQGQT